MAITDKTTGIWGLDQAYNKINQGSIWTYNRLASPLILAWGRNNYGNLGQNDKTDRSSPTQITASAATGWDLQLNFGEAKFLYNKKTDGTMWFIGANGYGQAGQNQGDSIDGYSSPVQLTGTNWDTPWSSPGQSVKSTKTDGTLWAWGASYWGELGMSIAAPSDWSRSSPIQIPGTNWATGRRKHTSGGNYVNAIKTDGTLWAWGYNAEGSLGIDSTANYSSPVQVPGTTWARIIIASNAGAAGAVKTDGTLWTWGANGYGILGQNNTTQYSSPKQVGSDTTWVNATFGANGTIAVKTDGTLWAWGYNSFGELGQNSTTTQYSSPIQIPGTTWDSTYMAGNNHGFAALKTDGTLWVWGQNSYGGLGLNSPTNSHRSSPTQIPGGYDQVIGSNPGFWVRYTNTEV